MPCHQADNENHDQRERAIAFGIAAFYADTGEAEASLNELADLIEAAGGECLRTFYQPKTRIEAATVLGSGKVRELAELAERLEANCLVCDAELSGSQIRNLEQATGCKVLDRSLLILDIFARRAMTAEGKLQVELAQLESRLSRLAGMGQALSRLGGGIGTRGPGETQLESDRRHIRRRIDHLRAATRKMAARRDISARRRDRHAFRVALVGYTNVGKSSLINRLCSSDLAVMDAVFATLDPAVRRLTAQDGRDLLLIDTVGFIRRLPTTLINAFHSTLEVAARADLILLVSDASDRELEQKEEVVHEVLKSLGASEIPCIHVLNKIDRLPEARVAPRYLQGRPATAYAAVVPVSAVTGEGTDQLLKAIEEERRRGLERLDLLLPYEQGALLALVYEKGRVLDRADAAEGIRIRCQMPAAFALPLHTYRVDGIPDGEGRQGG